MATKVNLFLFGDQSYDTQPYLRDLVQYHQHPVLEAFLVKAYNSIRTEIYNLPAAVRDELPRFTCLDDLLLRKPDGRPCVPLDMAVTCMYQIGHFIQQVETSKYPAEDSVILGICTGALAAAAVNCSGSALELVPFGVEAVTLAFRTGVYVENAARGLEVADPSGNVQSWSILVPGLSAAKVVRDFCGEVILPLTSKPYVSAYSPNGVTVSGPPRSLAKLAASQAFKSLAGSKSIPIYGPYHAPHLYSEVQAEEIVATLSSCTEVEGSGLAPLLSGSGTIVEGRKFKALLKDAVAQILLQPIRWNDVIEKVQKLLEKKAAKSFNIVPIGTKADQLIYTAIRQTALRSILSTPQTQTTPLSTPDSSPPLSHGKPKLAIIGMSGRFPGAEDNDAFWDLLYQGLDVHKPVPALHWDAKTHVDPTGTRKNTSRALFGCWLDNPAVFDARFFNISPREASQIDPAQRLALMTAYEAIEQAGIVPDATPSTRRDRVGVFYGVTSNDWMETNSAQNIDTYFIPGGNRAFIPGRINYYFKFSGPSYAVDTACSSSLAGIHLACNSLWRGEIDTAIAGGTNVLTNPDFTAGLDRGHFLSRTGNCKTFDDSADGYCRGEGIGTVIIKRLDDALADKDPILGVILGASTNHSAESESITRPHVGAQRAIFTRILNQGAVDPYSVSYVEMHGTGTQAGDAGEMSSVLETFAPPLHVANRGRTKDDALYLGSAKSNIGHGEAASGVSSLIKVLLMMQKEIIVPHCGIKTKINHKFPTDLEERNVNIALKPRGWQRSIDPSKPRRAFINNFSAAGGNSALLLEDAPLENVPVAERADPRSHHLVAVSAKNGASLQGNLSSLLRFIKEKGRGLSLGQLSYTTTARRLHHPHRVMLAISSMEEACKQIETALHEGAGVNRPKSAPKIIFAFTGQGAQYPGMFKHVFEHFSLFRTELSRLSHIAQSLGFPSVLPVIQSEEQDIGLFEPIVVQLAGLCTQIAMSKLWASWGITPSAIVGHSLGEYAALNIAGVLSDADTIYLLGKRAELLQSKCVRNTHSMLVVNGSVEEIAAALPDETYQVACINSPIETVLAGPNNDISSFKKSLTATGIRSTLLKVPFAFHSSQMDAILEEYKTIAREMTFSQARIPVLCPLKSTIVNGGDDFGAEYLAQHTRQPVNMMGALSAARREQYITDQTTVLEVGPHPAISSMIKAVLGCQIRCLASLQRGRSTWQILSNTLKALYTTGNDIRWAQYHRDFEASQKVISLPAYSWDLKEYWIQYVNDWSLRKGDPPLVTCKTNEERLESTTIHRVVEESGDPENTHMVVEADIVRKDLRPLVQGHEVDGIPLCTPSVYADIALRLGVYVLRRYRPELEDQVLIDVSDMTISKALILRAGASQQLLQAHAEVNWNSNIADIKFMSFDARGKLQEHSRCAVRFKDRSLKAKLQNEMLDVKRRIQALRDGLSTGATARFNRPMVYRAIRPLARFHDDYRAIDEIVLNSKTYEASSRLSFGSVKRGGNFHTHPAIIDSLTQSCGFTMNCNDNSDLDIEVFMNHGWGSFQIFQALDFEKEYTTYTRMTEGSDKLWRGDVVVLDGDAVVAFFGQIAIQGVPRRVLKVILSIESGNTQSQRQHQAIPKQQPTTSVPSAIATRSVKAPDHVNTELNTASGITQALSIIAEESGLAKSDLNDNTAFADVGIDSLMGLTISARFREELDIDLDFNALFYDYPTIGDLKAFLDGDDSPNRSSSSASESRATTPATVDDFITEKVNFERILQVVSEESGVSAEDLTEDTNFADAGVDSLLSLVIVSRFRDELGLNIQHESLFLDCPTVADLRRLLFGDSEPVKTTPILEEPKPVRLPSPPTSISLGDKKENSEEDMSSLNAGDIDSLSARKAEVDGYIQRYTAGFSAPVPSSSPSGISTDGGDVVLVTGASGSLGSHLVYHLAQLPNVKTVVCLNRENKDDPYTRQVKAMRGKGIRFPVDLKSKLQVLQTDSSKPRLGLSGPEYDKLVLSVTHLIHSAWPMSAKRALAGFEPQFQVMRNLIDLGSYVVAHRPTGFKFSFQMISSIGVVGHYALGNGKDRTMVPEERVDIDSVLPNGYGYAKWACERILDETIHKYPEVFRTMVVRLGQIAGSKTSGYWNPMEHFGFLIKSSQTLKALPDVDGTVFWTPVNDIAASLSDMALSDQIPYPVYHIENPVGQSWKEMNAILADALQIHSLIPFDEWVTRVAAAPQRNNPASTLLDFLDSNYLRMSCGGLVLETKKALEHSQTLRGVGPVPEETVRKYIHIWKEIGFLS